MDFQDRRLTYADYRSWDETERRCELIDGHCYAMSSPSAAHQAILLSLALQLGPQLAGGNCRLWLSPFDVKLTEHDVVQPDLFITCEPGKIRSNHLEGPPDLIIEVLSPSTLRHDRVRKLNLYARTGVREYWLVTPHPFLVEVMHNVQGTFTVSGNYTEEHQLRSPNFPALTFDLTAVLASLPPQPPIDEVRETAPTFGGPEYSSPLPAQ
jgi:Uma2 family endonuclease